MKRIFKIGAQGDVLFRRVTKIPEGYTESDDRVVAHSETGHNHVAVGELTVYRNPSDQMLAYMRTEEPIIIEHHRDHDTHEEMQLWSGEKGEVVWEIRRQREYTPEGWRRVED